MRTKLLFISFLLSAVSSRGQYLQCNQEIGVGLGTFSSEQVLDGTSIGVLAPTMRQYGNTSVTGTWFADYKFFISKTVSLGVYAGTEGEKGNWYHDDMTGRSDDWTTTKIGTFTRSSYTIAAELSFSYANRADVRIYSTFGAGAMIKKETDVYDQVYYNSGYYNGINMYGPNIASTNHVTRLDAYYSPLGMSFGRRLRGFFELGIGYKGILNGGLCYKINTLPGRLHRLPEQSAAPIIIVPHDMAVGSDDLQRLDHLQSCRFPSRHHSGFDDELAKVVAKTQNERGNVFYLTDINQRGEANRYSIRGTAAYAADYAGFKARVDAEKNKPFKEEQCAYVVVYCAPLGDPGRVRIRASVTVNDTGSVLMSWNTKYVMKLTKEDKVVVGTDKNKITIYPKFGKTSYIKLSIRTKRTWAHIVDETQGELESSLVKMPK